MKKNWILGFLGFLGLLGIPGIFTQDWKVFEGIFGSKNEFQEHINSLNRYRNILDHSHPDDPIVRKRGEAAVIWFENVFDKNSTNKVT